MSHYTITGNGVLRADVNKLVRTPEAQRQIRAVKQLRVNREAA